MTMVVYVKTIKASKNYFTVCKLGSGMSGVKQPIKNHIKQMFTVILYS